MQPTAPQLKKFIKQCPKEQLAPLLQLITQRCAEEGLFKGPGLFEVVKHTAERTKQINKL